MNYETSYYKAHEARRAEREDFTPLQQVACWIFALVFFTGLLLVSF